jgi:hypothetical protein
MKQKLRAHESGLVNQEMTKRTWEPFNESSNKYGHMRDVQWIKQWLRAHERRSMNQPMNTGTREPFNESSNDYGQI